MSRIVRTEPNQVFARAVEYHGFVFTQGMVARDLDADIKGQTRDVLAQIDDVLEQHGTDKTRLLQAQVWLRDLSDREGMNEIWSAWLPPGGAPARACVEAKLVDPRMRVEIMVTTCK
ncbi:MAG: RidA family protein [Acetobacteraceae bacterium]|nr:RidA family protein [Acetobacteraceae bacterium]